MKNTTKNMLLPLACIFLLLSTVACAADLQDESSFAPVLEDGVTGIQDALELETEEDSNASVASSPVAKEDGVVLIYNGEVAAEGCPEALAAVAESIGLEVAYFGSADALSDLLNGSAMCIIGGTEDDLDPLFQEFTPEIRTALAGWIESGGGFLGICGGAYIGSQGWEEDGGFVEMLGLVPVVAEEYLSDPDPHIITVDWNGERRAIYYAYGPAFLVKKSPGVEIIATYDDGRAAALEYTYGEGHVILSGPHPEADETWLDDDPAPLNAGQWEDTSDLIKELFRRLI